MKIVIAGAGDIGFHLAKLLTYEQQAITLIDTNQDVLDYAASHLDVFTVKGDSSSMSVLERAEVHKAKLFIAATTFQNNNILSAILAKKIGAKRTIARVQNQEFLTEEMQQHFKEMGVDDIISPRKLAAEEISRLINRVSLTDSFEFEQGKFSLFGFTLDNDSPLKDMQIEQVSARYPTPDFRPIAILRGHQTIIPRSMTTLRSNDHIYFMTPKKNIDDVLVMAGKKDDKVKRVLILGGTDVSYITAELLEHKYSTTLIESKPDVCNFLAEKLNSTLIIKGNYSDVELLKEEGLQNMDALLALTPNTETNIITCLMAKGMGVKKTIALVENIEYTHISQNIGVDTLINKKLLAAHNIFRFVRKGQIEAITGLHGVDAEVIEFVVTKRNRITKYPLRKLHFPQKSLIGGVIRGNQSIIPTGDFQIQQGDKVIVFALPEAISRVEELFR